MLRGVVAQFAQRRRPASAALVEEDDPVERRIEELTVTRGRPAARTAVQEYHRDPARIARLFPRQRMQRIDFEPAAAIRIDRGKKAGAYCAHMKNITA